MERKNFDLYLDPYWKKTSVSSMKLTVRLYYQSDKFIIIG